MIKINGVVIKQQQFPDGTWLLNNIRSTFEEFKFSIEIDWKYEGEHEISFLYFIAKHLKNVYTMTPITLKCYYFPNARMDRTYNRFEIFTLKYFCELINSLNFSQVILMDVHSNVTNALLNNVVERPLLELNDLIINYRNIYFPDEGAQKRYSKVLDLSNKYVYTGMKKRNWATGKIEGLDVFSSQDSPNKDSILMIDDICSRGGTFFHSAKKLKSLGFDNIDAYCTHAEPVVNDETSDIHVALNGKLINKLYTTDSLLQNTENKNIIIYHV